MEMFPADDKIGWYKKLYKKCAPGCLEGFCRGDRQLAVAVGVRFNRQDGEIAQQDSRDSFI